MVGLLPITLIVRLEEALIPSSTYELCENAVLPLRFLLVVL